MTAAVAFEFRRAGPADAADVRAMSREAYAKWIPVVGREPLPMRADYALAVVEHEVDLLLADGVVVGLIEMMARDDHVWIENVAVVPARQGEGFGRRLMARAEAVAVARGLGCIRLLTNGSFASNVELYKRLGYRVDREEPFAQGGTTVYMSKAIEE